MGMWAAQALAPSPGFGSCRLGPPGASPTDGAGRARAWGGGGSGSRKHPVSCPRNLALPSRRCREKGALCPNQSSRSCRSRLPDGQTALGSPLKALTAFSSLCRRGWGAARCAVLRGSQASGGAQPQVPLSSGFPMGFGSCQNQFQKCSPPPHDACCGDTVVGGNFEGLPRLKDDHGPKIKTHGRAMLTAEREALFVPAFYQVKSKTKSFLVQFLLALKQPAQLLEPCALCQVPAPLPFGGDWQWPPGGRALGWRRFSGTDRGERGSAGP